MSMFKFGENKVGFGVVSDEKVQYLFIHQAEEERKFTGFSLKDAFLQFPNRKEFQKWVDQLQELAPQFRE